MDFYVYVNRQLEWKRLTKSTSMDLSTMAMMLTLTSSVCDFSRTLRCGFVLIVFPSAIQGGFDCACRASCFLHSLEIANYQPRKAEPKSIDDDHKDLFLFSEQ